MLRIREKILCYQIKNGDEQAFTIFYNFYKDKIYRFIYFKISDKEKAQELLSDTFMNVFNYLKQGKEIENMQALLYKSARNLVIDFYRAQKQDVSLDEVAELASEMNISQQVENKIKIQNIEQAVKELPEEYRQVVNLRFIEDLSFDEISEIIGKSSGNCRVLAHRGLKKLKELINF